MPRVPLDPGHEKSCPYLRELERYHVLEKAVRSFEESMWLDAACDAGYRWAIEIREFLEFRKK